MTFLLLFDSLFDINTKMTLDCLNEEVVKLLCELILTHITLHPIPYFFLHSPLRNYYKVSFLISLSCRILGII